MKLPTDAKTSIVIMQVRIVRIELTTKDWKSPILPLNYIRKLSTQNRTRTYNPFIRSEVLYPIELSVHLRLIARSLFGDRKEEHHLNAPMNNKCVSRPLVKYGEQDSNLHEISLITSLVLRDYQFHHLRIKGWFPTPTNDRKFKI